jgi:hypothetical protein
MTEPLTAQRVNTIFMTCLFKDDEEASECIVAEGIMHTVGFHRGRIEDHRQDIHDMLAELPIEFKASGGDGSSFGNACLDRHGTLWTGEHPTMEQLVQLGIAIDEVEYCLPRDLWEVIFPGMLPYFRVKQ